MTDNTIYDVNEYYSPEKHEFVKPQPNYKFNEGKLMAEIKEYIDSTYSAHYSREKFQATEFIFDGGHGTGFCIGNMLKYTQRYGKKGTRADARKDLMKVIHYAILQLHVHDEENKRLEGDA